MKNKQKIILIVGIIILLSIACISYIIIINNSNLIKLNYNEILEKVNNKEDFILCVTAENCIHCKEFKPKLKKIANSYNIKIYYANVDDFTEEEYKTFKTEFSFDGGTPTTIFFKKGEEKTTATRIEGNAKFEKIINKIKSNGFITE